MGKMFAIVSHERQALGEADVAIVMSVKESIWPWRAHSRFKSPRVSPLSSRSSGLPGRAGGIHLGHVDGPAGEGVLLDNEPFHQIRPGRGDRLRHRRERSCPARHKPKSRNVKACRNEQQVDSPSVAA